jgi:hypothetical protein
VVTPLVIGLLMYGHVSHAVRSLVPVPALVQQVGWAALVVLAAIAARRASVPRIEVAGTALARLGAILVAVTLVLIVPFEAAHVTGVTQAGEHALAKTTSAQKRDVYWLVFDRYGSDRAHMLEYGIRNDLTPWLGGHAFTVLADSHANYVRTALSIGTTVSMAHVADMPGVPRPQTADVSFIDDKIRSSLVARQFQALGYRYVNIGSWWDPTGASPLADVNLRLPGPSEFVSTLVDGTALPAIQKRLHLTKPVDKRVRHFENNEYGLDAIERMRNEPGPKFVFGHVLLPHPPLVYDRDGTFMDLDDQRGLSGKDRYARQLAYTNERIRGILTGLLSLPEAQRPVIILQADEGPWPAAYSAQRDTFEWASASDDTLEAKYGILNAWYVPGAGRVGLYPTMTSINTFPVLFRDYFGLPYAPLADRVYTSKRWALPFDLTDVTDRLPSLR